MSAVTRVVATQATLGPLIDLTGLSSAQVNALLNDAEAAQPEGALMLLTIEQLGIWANPIANHINSLYAQGQIVYQPTGEKIEAWPGTSVIATVPQNGVIQLRWVKLQWFAFVLVGLMLGVLITYIALETLHHAPYTMTATIPNAQGSTTPTSGPPFAGVYDGTVYLFYLPWYWDLGIAGILAIGPWALERLSRGEYSLSDLIRGHRALEEAEQ